MEFVNELKDNKIFGEESDIQRGLIPVNDDPNKKVYLILYQYTEHGDEAEEGRIWEIKEGRQNTYEHLRDLTVAEAIDPNNSYILAEPVAMRDMGTVIGFLEAMYDDSLVEDESGFDPYDYDIEYAED